MRQEKKIWSNRWVHTVAGTIFQTLLGGGEGGARGKISQPEGSLTALVSWDTILGKKKVAGGGWGEEV
jgi:hypothetical protein